MKTITRFGNLVIDGNLPEGRLTSFRNSSTGMEITTDPNKPLITLIAEKGGHEVIAGLPGGPEGITLQYDWASNTSDSVACKVKFKNPNPAYAVRKIIFTLPACIDLSGQGKDSLVYPYGAGVKIEDPAAELFTKWVKESAAWKDRILTVSREGFGFLNNQGDTVDLCYPHLSMMWLDYCTAGAGFYLASHDPGFEHAFFHVTARRNQKGLTFGIEQVFNRQLPEWEGKYIIGLHSGDWHRGADIYRLFHEQLRTETREPPAYIRKAPGMVCHYDFKWQNGDINHLFRDLPQLFKEAQANGFTALLMAGWHHNGFDNNYPCFRPDPELGTEQDLIDGVKAVHQLGGQVFFYNNAYSFDKESPDYQSTGKAWAAKKFDGSTYDVRWGSRILTGMCNSAGGWREKVKNNVKYLIEQVKADGVYIDQLSVPPRVCYDRSHQHQESWILNNVSLIKEIRDELGAKYEGKIFLFSEFFTDALLPVLDSQLIHTCWMTGIKYAFPEMCKYTFPTASLMDQVLQKPWPGNPPETEENHVRDIIGKMFVNGIFFWTYDHVISNPRLHDFFMKAVNFKTRFAGYFSGGIFEDDTIFRDLPPNVCAKSFRAGNGKRLVAVYNKTGQPCFVTLKEPAASPLSVYDSEGHVTKKIAKGKIVALACSADPLSVITMG